MKTNIKSEKTLFINGKWLKGSGTCFYSTNPSNGFTVWEGSAASIRDVDYAVQWAREGFSKWSSLALSKRITYLERFASCLKQEKDALVKAISTEVGKPLWEASNEVSGMLSKIPISIEAYYKRCAEFSNGSVTTRFKPHGVVAVFGAFNFPCHIPNGHIIPALLAGNAIIFKPSPLTPLCAEVMMRIWAEVGLPDGTINLLQGGKQPAEALVNHSHVAGVFFTGSAEVGVRIAKGCAQAPNKILALEMGGNNPLLVQDVKNINAAALLAVQSAFLTSGQRCTCARRLIVLENEEGEQLIEALIDCTSHMQIGPPEMKPEPFMGPVVSATAAKKILEVQANLLNEGAKVLLESKHLKPNTGFISPGIIDVTPIKKRQDREIFGPLLQVIRVKDFDMAIKEANNTAFGLSAGIFTDDANLYNTFSNTVQAGIISWNQPLTGASSYAPFGGVGLSGNHRPTGYFAADYCAYPVASNEEPVLQPPQTPIPGLTPLTK